jgi:hypothetical protein
LAEILNRRFQGWSGAIAPVAAAACDGSMTVPRLGRWTGNGEVLVYGQGAAAADIFMAVKPKQRCKHTGAEHAEEGFQPEA